MTTTLLGSSGRLGTILVRNARRARLGWRFQARSGSADLHWSGAYDDIPGGVFNAGGTLINMIGTTNGDAATLHDINVHFVENILNKAAQCGVAHVVLASSAAVYGADDAPFAENAPLDTTSPYGVSKVAMERVAMAFGAKNAPAITILRIGNVAGADALTAVAQDHAAAGTRMPLHRFADGSAPVRSYIGPVDLFRTVRDLSIPHEGKPRIINVAHPQPVTLEAMLRAYRTHVFPSLTWADAPVPRGIPRSVILSTKTLQRHVDYTEFNDPAAAFAAQVAECSAL